jgi:diguanylate cyclase (GGDEF)-like protein
MTLFEPREDGDGLEVTLHAGAPRATGLELRLAEQAIATVAELDEYTAGGLCLARPLRAYGEPVGALVLHLPGRPVLDDAELDGLRRFCEVAAAALANALVRAKLDAYAYTDHLTGLANRRRLEREFGRLAGTRLALLLVDFDGLKAVNDSLGYDDGDRLIAAVGAALAALARPGELVARYGGDEFVVMIEGLASAHARERADEITAALDRLKLPASIAAHFRGASVGWATVEAGENAPAALSRAAAEMRSRKRRRKTDREASEKESRGITAL